MTFVDNFGGKQSEVFNGIDFAINARIRSDLFVTGGFATGNTHFNNCDAFVDNPRTDFGISASAGRRSGRDTRDRAGLQLLRLRHRAG